MTKALTIGNFDGVHAGHKRILKRLQELSDKPTVFTFSNHPSEVLQDKSKELLIRPEHKLALLEELGVETISEPFTEEFSQQSPEEFLKRFEFDHLVLGPGAAFGHNRSGQSSELERLSRKMGFDLEYIPPLQYRDQTVSSSLIRETISKGDFITALPLLGRPYSIQGKVIHGAKRGLGIPTANMDVSGLCLPPFGVYHVRVGDHIGIANLGTAPTFDEKRKQLEEPLRSATSKRLASGSASSSGKNLDETYGKGVIQPLLEAHLLDFEGDLYGKTLDVMFLRYIRPEKRFETKEALVQQIEKDLASLFDHSF